MLKYPFHSVREQLKIRLNSPLVFDEFNIESKFLERQKEDEGISVAGCVGA
jgi:hypothetical protein